MHVDEERIQRLLHRQLDADEAKRLALHLEDCGPCRARLDEGRTEEEEMARILRALDHPVPVLEPEAIAARARATGSASPTWGRWAAGVLLALLVSVGAYAAPGSPLPGWWDAFYRSLSGPAPREVGISDSSVSGVSVAPGEDLTVVFRVPPGGGVVRIALDPGSEMVVEASEGSASYTSAEGSLVVDAREAGASFQVRIPRQAPRVEILVGRRSVFLKDGDRIVTESAGTGDPSLGPWLVPLGGSG